MILPIGSACRVRESYDRIIKIKRETNFFDWIVSNFETVLYFIKNIDKKIEADDIYDTNKLVPIINKRIICHKKVRIQFLHDMDGDKTYESQLPEFLDKLNRRLKRLKEHIKFNSYIDFLHLVDASNSSFDFFYNPEFRESNIYIPSNKMIDKFVFYIKKINPNLDFKLNLLIYPEHSDENKDIIDSLNNKYLKIHYMTKDNNPNANTCGASCIHWDWIKVYENINHNLNGLPYDFNPTNYKNIYKDLINMTNEEATKHYLKYGIREKRIYNPDLFKYFDVKSYKNKYHDISNFSNKDATLHYYSHGIFEGR